MVNFLVSIILSDYPGEFSVSLLEIYNKVRRTGHISNMFATSSENKSFCSVLANVIEWQVCFKIKRKKRTVRIY